MHSPSPKTTIFVLILFALLFSLRVSGSDVLKREPQNQQQTTSSSAPASTSPASPSNPSSGGPSGTSAPSSTVSGSGNSTSPSSNSTSDTSSTSAPTPPDPNTPAILVQMTEPASAKNILFKIGSNITFGWKYSGSFSDGYAPKAINVLAQSSLDQNSYYTIAANASGSTTKVIWITATESSLPMTTYRLFIFDERGINGPSLPGALSVFEGLQFGMYTPQGRTDLPEYSCATCDGVSLDIPYIPILMTFGVSLITLIYFSFGLS